MPRKIKRHFTKYNNKHLQHGHPQVHKSHPNSLSTHSHSSGGKRVLRVFLILILSAAFIFLGYFLMNFVMQYLQDHREATASATSSQLVSQVSSAAVSTVSSEPPAAPVSPTQIQAALVPENSLQSETALQDWMAAAKADGINMAVMVLKAPDGTLRYDSQLPEARQIRAVDQPIPDLQAKLQQLQAQGFTVAAQMDCFNDPLAAGRMSGGAIHYNNTSTLWLDNYPDKGGKPHLNPYSPVAREYLLGIAKELTAMGFNQILLRSVQFPEANLTSATFGENTSQSKSEVLATFVTAMEDAVKTQNAGLILTLNARYYIQNTASPYGDNPMLLSADVIALDFSLSNFPPNIAFNGQTFHSAAANPSGLLTAALQDLRSKTEALGGERRFIACLPTAERETPHVMTSLQNGGIQDFLLLPT